MSDESRPPLPPFTRETAVQRCAAPRTGGTPATRSGSPSPTRPTAGGGTARSSSRGGRQIVAFLTRKWAKELDYRLIKELWAFDGDRIAVRFAYEWHDDSGAWFRSYGNENWEFDENGLMRRRHASINDLPIDESDRKFHWDLGPPSGRPPGPERPGL